MYFDHRHHMKLIRDTSALGTIVDQELYATDVASRFNANVHWLKLLLCWPRAFVLTLVSPWAAFKYSFNDPDRNRRREALSMTIDELPDTRSPSYLLAAGVIVTVIVFWGAAALVLLTLPLSWALATLAVLGLALASGLRLSESAGVRPRTTLGKLREIFPF